MPETFQDVVKHLFSDFNFWDFCKVILIPVALWYIRRREKSREKSEAIQGQEKEAQQKFLAAMEQKVDTAITEMRSINHNLELRQKDHEQVLEKIGALGRRMAILFRKHDEILNHQGNQDIKIATLDTKIDNLEKTKVKSN